MKGSRLAIQPFDLQDSTFLGLLTRSAVFSYVSFNQSGCLPANLATIESRDKITGIYYPTFGSLFALVNTAIALKWITLELDSRTSFCQINDKSIQSALNKASNGL